MRIRAGALAAALLLTVAACGGSSSPEAGGTPSPGGSSGGSGTQAAGATPTSRSTSTPSGDATGGNTVADVPPVCRLLTAQERKELVGKAVDRVIPVSGPGEGFSCRWVEADTLSPTTLVQVTAMPASTWATTLPSVLRQLESSGAQLSDADRRELAAARKVVTSGKRVGPRQACGLFSVLSELGGAPKGSKRTVNLLPVGRGLGVSASTCTHGHFTSVVFTEPGLKGSERLTAAATAVLAKAQHRAIAAG